jgi:hypothetical protein
MSILSGRIFESETVQKIVSAWNFFLLRITVDDILKDFIILLEFYFIRTHFLICLKRPEDNRTR